MTVDAAHFWPLRLYRRCYRMLYDVVTLHYNYNRVEGTVVGLVELVFAWLVVVRTRSGGGMEGVKFCDGEDMVGEMTSLARMTFERPLQGKCKLYCSYYLELPEEFLRK